MTVSSYLIDDLVGFSRGDKVDTLGMESVGLSLRHLVGLLVLHLYKYNQRYVIHYIRMHKQG